MKSQLKDNISVNKLRSIDQPVHDWYRFVLSFPPHLVRDYLERFSISSEHNVLDPFCGTGTTLVECKKTGIPSFGIEANPMSYFSSKVKTDWSPDPECLRSVSLKIYQLVDNLFEKEGIFDVPGIFESGILPKNLKRLSPEKEAIIVKNSISPLPLHKALTLLKAIQKNGCEFMDHLKLAFAKALVSNASNLHFGPEVGVRKSKYDAPILSPWLEYIQNTARDIEEFSDNALTPSKVIFGDARCPTDYIQPDSIDFVFTSPPYPNEKDYTRTTRLESALLGFINSKDELRNYKKDLLRSNTRNVYKEDQDHLYIREFPEIIRLADMIEQRRVELGKTSGFERQYARVTKLYFGGMTRHLSQLQKVLKPGAVLAYVVGDQASFFRILIRTGRIIAQIAKYLGYDLIGIDLFRKRMSTVTKEYLNEEVVLLKWTGKR